MRLLCEIRTDCLKGVKTAVLFKHIWESGILVTESCLCKVPYHLTSDCMRSDINFSITYDLHVFIYSFSSLLSHLLGFCDILKRSLSHLSDGAFKQQIYPCWLWQQGRWTRVFLFFQLVQALRLKDFYIADLNLGESLGPIDRTEKISFIWRQSYCKKKAWIYTSNFN